MTAAQAGEERGIVAKRVLSGAGLSGTRLSGIGQEGIAGTCERSGERGARSRDGGTQGDAVQKVAAADGAVHAQCSIPGFVLLSFWHDFRENVGLGNFRPRKLP